MFSDPVVGIDFFGREEVLETLRKRVEAFLSGYRQNVALIGHEKLGKTSILHQFLHAFGHKDVIPVYVELKPRQALDYFADQFVRALLFEYLKRKQSIESIESYDPLLPLAKRFIPDTVREISCLQEDLRRKNTESAYSRLLELTSHLHRESGNKCVVILDEFHRIGDFGLRNAFVTFGKRIMLQKDTLYIISSSSLTVSRQILAEKLSLLFGNFERISLGPFSFESADRFIDKKLGEARMPEDLKKYLIALTDAHPFFLNVICRRLRQDAAAGSRPLIGTDELVAALQSLFFDSEGILNQYFTGVLADWTKNSKGNHPLILVHLANGVNRLKDLAAAIKRGQAEASRQLKELMAKEIVVKNGVFYHFHDKLFCFWLKTVCRPKEFSLLVNTPAKALSFRAECLKQIEAFLAASKREPRDRIVELLGRFHNDRVEFDSKGKRLPAFNEILAGVPDPGESPKPIVAKTRGLSWVCHVVESESTERDVLDLIRQCPKGKSSRVQKVLISLNGMGGKGGVLGKNHKGGGVGLQKRKTLLDV